jgi:hypothetical protein
MRHVVDETGIEYVGADIVPRLIDENRRAYAREGIRFLVADILVDPFPRADLWLCRDCLFHLSYRDICGALTRFLESSIPLILTTTYETDAKFANADIQTGDFRRIDLSKAPFSLPPAIETLSDEGTKRLVLLNREQVAETLPRMTRAVASLRPPSRSPGAVVIARLKSDFRRWRGESERRGPGVLRD